MKKVIIENKIYWYNRKLNFLFYDYKMKKQVAYSLLTETQFQNFLKQIYP